jgi:hypothetical protein
MCPKAEKASEAKVEPVIESSLSNVNCSQVFLQTIMVKLRGVHERKIRVLLDPGSQRSYIKNDVAQYMQYKPTGEEELIHGLFGGEMTSPAVISAIRYDYRVSTINMHVILKHSMRKRYADVFLPSCRDHG